MIAERWTRKMGGMVLSGLLGLVLMSGVAWGQSIPMEPMVSHEKQAPAFKVTPRKDSVLKFYPCTECHNIIPGNPQEREFKSFHLDIALDHGGGRFWCSTCHHTEERDYLRSSKNNLIDYDKSYRLCGQCHFQRQKDWFYGGHGKRVGHWDGERTIMLCTECHNPHSPSIKPVVPSPPPKVRSGLPFVPTEHHDNVRLWDKYLNPNNQESHE